MYARAAGQRQHHQEEERDLQTILGNRLALSVLMLVIPRLCAGQAGALLMGLPTDGCRFALFFLVVLAADQGPLRGVHVSASSKAIGKPLPARLGPVGSGGCIACGGVKADASQTWARLPRSRCWRSASSECW